MARCGVVVFSRNSKTSVARPACRWISYSKCWSSMTVTPKFRMIELFLCFSRFPYSDVRFQYLRNHPNPFPIARSKNAAAHHGRSRAVAGPCCVRRRAGNELGSWQSVLAQPSMNHLRILRSTIGYSYIIHINIDPRDNIWILDDIGIIIHRI